MSGTKSDSDVSVVNLIDERRSKYLRYSSQRLAVVTMVMSVLVVILGAPFLIIPLGIIGLIAWQVPNMIDHYGVEVAGHSYLGTVAVTASGLCWVTGGIKSAAVLVVLVAAAMGALALRPRGALLWSLFGAGQIAALGVAAHYEVELPLLVEPASMENVYPVVAFIITVMIYSLLIRNQRAFNEQIVHASLNALKLQGARAEVEQASQALQHSDLLESGSNALVSRMNTRANHGRAALAQAMEHMKDVVSSYRSVQPRLEELETRGRRSHAHSDEIRTRSKQIDLMAINTALVAARMGKVSQQFKPVSEEMRRQAGAATRELDALEQDLLGMSSNVFQTKDTLQEASEDMSSLGVELGEVRTALDGLLDLFEESVASTRNAQELSRAQLELVGDLLATDSDRAEARR